MRNITNNLALMVFTVLCLAVCVYGNPVTLNVPSEVYPTIQSAIDNASNGDTVEVTSGTYTEKMMRRQIWNKGTINYRYSEEKNQ